MSLIKSLFIFTLIFGVITGLPFPSDEHAAGATGPEVFAPGPEATLPAAAAAAAPPPLNASPGNPPISPLGNPPTVLVSDGLPPGQGIAKIVHRKGPHGSEVTETVYTGSISQDQLAHLTGLAFQNMNINPYGNGFGFPMYSPPQYYNYGYSPYHRQ